MNNISSNRFRWSCVVVLTLAVIVVVPLWVQRGEAQTFSPYADFEAMSPQELKTLQVELSPQGSQEGSLLPVTFTSTVNTIDVSQFVPFHRAGLTYASGPGVTFKATPEELKGLIANVGTLPNVTAGGAAAFPRLVFILVNSGKGFQAVLNESDAATLFDQLRLSLANNRDGLLALGTLACPLDLLPAGTATDVSANVSVALSGVRLNRTTGRFVGTATATNKSAASLPGPVSAVFLLASNVELANVDGTTCGTKPAGLRFINLPLVGNELPPGGSAQVSLEFRNPDRLPIKAAIKVLAGPGAR